MYMMIAWVVLVAAYFGLKAINARKRRQLMMWHSAAGLLTSTKPQTKEERMHQWCEQYHPFMMAESCFAFDNSSLIHSLQVRAAKFRQANKEEFIRASHASNIVQLKVKSR